MKLLGKGAFTKAFLMDNGKVLLNTCDPVKEVMAHGWFPESYLFPQLEFVDRGVYIMDYLPKVKAPKKQLNERSYKLYLKLREVFENTCWLNERTRFQELHKLFDEHLKDFPEEQGVIKEALYACGSTGFLIQFEISPRNISCTEDGQLILADCFFNIEMLRKVKSGEIKPYRSL